MVLRSVSDGLRPGMGGFMKTRRIVLVVSLLALLAAGSLAPAQVPDKDNEPDYDLAGTWYAWNSVGIVYVYTITRLAPNEYSIGGGGSTASPATPDVGTTTMTGSLGTVRRVAKNTYAGTTVNFHGTIPGMWNGPVYAEVYSGTIRQVGPDELYMELTGGVSCNPCLGPTLCWNPNLCDPSSLWDPFAPDQLRCINDDTNPILHWGRRIPQVEVCTEGDD